MSPFNYAENEPVGHIDLWGLQKAVYVTHVQKTDNGHEILGRTSGKIKDYTDDISATTYLWWSNQEKYGKTGTLDVISFQDGSKIERYTPDSKNSKGGIVYFMSDGQGGETRFSPNADIGALIDGILNAFTGAKAVGDLPSKAPGTLAGEIADILQFINNAFQVGSALQETLHKGDEKPNTNPGDTVRGTGPTDWGNRVWIQNENNQYGSEVKDKNPENYPEFNPPKDE